MMLESRLQDEPVHGLLLVLMPPPHSLMLSVVVGGVIRHQPLSVSLSLSSGPLALGDYPSPSVLDFLF